MIFPLLLLAITTAHVAAKQIDHLRMYNRNWGGHFTVGTDNDHWLVLDTVGNDTIIQVSQYESPKKFKGDLVNIPLQTVDISGTNHMMQTPSVAALDHVRMGALQSKEMLIWLSNVTAPASRVASRLGLGAAGSVSQTIGTDSRLQPFLSQVCNGVPGCNFGLSLGTGVAGKLITDGVEESEYLGQLKYNDVLHPWSLSCQLTTDPIGSSKSCPLSSLTTKILGSKDRVRELFRLHNIDLDESDPSRVTGSYDCANPPRIGFQFNIDTVYVHEKAIEYDKFGSKCYMAIEGVEQDVLNELAFASKEDEPAWILGQRKSTSVLCYCATSLSDKALQINPPNSVLLHEMLIHYSILRRSLYRLQYQRWQRQNWNCKSN